MNKWKFKKKGEFWLNKRKWVKNAQNHVSSYKLWLIWGNDFAAIFTIEFQRRVINWHWLDLEFYHTEFVTGKWEKKN